MKNTRKGKKRTTLYLFLDDTKEDLALKKHDFITFTGQEKGAKI